MADLGGLRRLAQPLLDESPAQRASLDELRRRARRRRARRRSGGVVAAALLIGLVAWQVTPDRTEEEDIATVPGERDETAAGRLAVPGPEGVRILGENGEVIADVAVDGDIRLLEWSSDGRWLLAAAGESAWLIARDGVDVDRLDLPSITDGRWAPAGATLAVNTLDGIYVLEPGTAPEFLAEGGAGAWSPGGERVAYVRDEEIRMIGVDGASDTFVTMVDAIEGADAGVEVVDWSPDGRSLLLRVFAERSNSLAADGVPLVALDVDTSATTRLPTTATGREELQWSPDGSTLLLVEGEGRLPNENKRLATCDVATWTCAAIPQPEGTVSLDPAWSPSGDRIAFVRGPAGVDLAGFHRETRLIVADPDGSNEREVAGAGPGALRPAWNGDGDALVYAAVAHTTPDVRIELRRIPVTGGSFDVLGARALTETETLARAHPERLMLAWSADVIKGAAREDATDPFGLAAGVTSVGLSTWGEEYDVWTVDDAALGDAVVTRLVETSTTETVPEPDGGERVTLRIVRGDGEVVARALDLGTGWVEPGYSLGAELADRLRRGLDDAVATSWQPIDLSADDEERPFPVLDAAGPPFDDPDTALSALLESFRATIERPELERYTGDVEEASDDRAVVIVRHRHDYDDSGRGTDYRFTLTATDGRWVVEELQARGLCRRGPPNGPDEHCV